MPLGMDIFNDPAFGLVQMTEAINIIPNQYGRVGDLGIFRNKGVETTSVLLELKNGVLNILPPTQRGGEATVNKSGKRKVKSLAILNYSLDDVVLPDEIQGVRAFGSTTEVETLQRRVLEKIEGMRRKHDITLEWLRVNAIQGKLLDDEGEVLLDLFDFFETTEKVIDFQLGTATTQVDQKCREVTRHMQKNLKGEVMNGIRALCSPSFYDAFIGHESVQKAYLAYQATTPFREDMRLGFYFQGINFEEYDASGANRNGKELQFIPDGDVRFIPMGTTETFSNYYAPADLIETVNTTGLPFYAYQYVTEDKRKCKIFTQSNPLPIVTRPNLLVRGKAS